VEVEYIIQISTTVLRELLSRWNESKQSFMFRENLVPLSLMDIHVGLRLRVGGEALNLEDDTEGLVNELFDGEEINVRSIMKKMTDEKFRMRENVDDFCMLYLLLSLVFYFPRSYKNFCSFPFRVLDNLDALHVYNWGVQFMNQLFPV